MDYKKLNLKSAVRADLADALHEQHTAEPGVRAAIKPSDVMPLVDKYEPMVSTILKEVGIFTPLGAKEVVLAFAELLDQAKAIADKYAGTTDPATA